MPIESNTINYFGTVSPLLRINEGLYNKWYVGSNAPLEMSVAFPHAHLLLYMIEG